MPPLRATPATCGDGDAMGWMRHVVRPLLCPPGALRSPAAHGARGHAVLHRPSQGSAYTGGCFAGPEGAGCALSEAEQRIGRWVGGEPMSWETDLASIPFATTDEPVVSAHSSPPVGTPSAPNQKGNSARPGRFVVAISEQVKR